MDDHPFRRGRLKFASKKLEQRIRELAYDPKLLDLATEIGFARAKLEQLEGEELQLSPAKREELIISVLSIIGRLVERMHFIDKERKNLVPLPVVQNILLAVGRACDEALPQQQRQDFLNRFQTLVRSELVKLPMPTRPTSPVIETEEYDERPSEDS